jgi:DNA-binding transcriptional LysR family regulator
MKAFVRVAETESFSEAARQLRVSKSVVTKRVAQLERLLETRLFHRSTRRVRLTDAGTAYYERAARLVAEVEDLDSTVGELKAEPRGELRVSSPTSFGVFHLGPAICEFQKRYPRLGVELILNDRPVNPIAEGFDIALQDGPPVSPLLIARRLAPVRRLVCAAPDYLRRRGRPRHPRELAAHDCIQYSFLPSGPVWSFDGPDGPVSVTVAPKLSTNSGQVMRDAAASGNGIAILPTLLIERELRSRALTPILAEWRLPELWIAAIYPQTHRLNTKVRLFTDFLAERFGPEPPWDRAAPRKPAP